MKKDGFPFDKVAGVSGAGQVSMIHKKTQVLTIILNRCEFINILLS